MDGATQAVHSQERPVNEAVRTHNRNLRLISGSQEKYQEQAYKALKATRPTF